MSDERFYLGLISGTSADGIDAALVRFSPQPALAAAHTFAYPTDLHAQILALSQQGANLTLDDIGVLDARIGEAFAEAAEALIADSGIERAAIHAIGSHGQTLRHRPDLGTPFTMQLGDASRIAERTGITTVADFRRRDIAAGGQGAPLAPAFHAATLHSPDEDRAVLNLGGIANLTLLPRIGQVRGFDTGPANGLMDAWIARQQGAAYDAGGAWAASGNVEAPLLAALCDDPWFALPPPKSTGRDQFHLGWLDARLAGNACRPEDVQATLCELTAVTIAEALRRTQPDTRRLLVCGGGVHNPRLLARIGAHLPGAVIESTAAHGLDPDFVEAMLFAWLARQTMAGQAGNLVSVTGARGPRVLGAIHPA